MGNLWSSEADSAQGADNTAAVEHAKAAAVDQAPAAPAAAASSTGPDPAELIASVASMGAVQMRAVNLHSSVFQVDFLLSSGLVCSAPLALDEGEWLALAQALEGGRSWKPAEQRGLCWLELTESLIVIHALATTYLPTPVYSTALARAVRDALHGEPEPLQFRLDESADMPALAQSSSEEMPALVQSSSEEMPALVDPALLDMPPLVDVSECTTEPPAGPPARSLTQMFRV